MVMLQRRKFKGFNMVKRLFLLVLVFSIFIALLVACEEDAEEPAPSPVPTEVMMTASPIPPTATRFVNPTLPPAATLQVGGGTTAPTRTLAPTITPAPTSTSNLLIPVTPDEPKPGEDTTTGGGGGVDDLFASGVEGPAFTISFAELTDQIRAYPVPIAIDTVAEDSHQVILDDTGLKLTFDVFLSGQAEPVNITAGIILDSLSSPGRVLVSLEPAYYSDTPAELYVDALTEELAEQLENALDYLIIENATSILEGSIPFAVVELTVSADGLNVKTVVQE